MDAFTAGTIPSARAFPNMPKRTAAMLMVDLEAAGIDYIDEAGAHRDFHSLRHSYISALVRSGAHPKVCQELARHSTIAITMDKYSHVALETEIEALDKLPDFGKREAEEMKATGTDDENPAPNVPRSVPFQDGLKRSNADQNGMETASKTK